MVCFDVMLVTKLLCAHSPALHEQALCSFLLPHLRCCTSITPDAPLWVQSLRIAVCLPIGGCRPCRLSCSV